MAGVQVHTSLHSFYGESAFINVSCLLKWVAWQGRDFSQDSVMMWGKLVVLWNLMLVCVIL